MSLAGLVSKSYGRKSRDEHRQVAKAADLCFSKPHDAPAGFYLPTKDYMTQTKCVLESGWIVEKPKEEEKKGLEDNKFHPRNFQDKHNANIKHAHGTTTLAFIFDGGILVAVDSRATMGSYIGSYTVKKVIPITKYIIGTMAGGAADCSYWERMLQLECRILELRNKDRMTVAAASKILANWCNAYKSYGLSIGAMMAGWDKRGPQLYYVDSDGMRLQAEYGFSVGSGSLYAYGVMDTEYRPDLTVEEAISLGRRAIYHATHRDAASGGYINVFHITEEGWTQISHDDCFDVHQGYYPERYANPVPVEERKDDEDGDVPMQG